MYKFLAPLLSAQFSTDATPQPKDILSLPPLRPPRPRFMVLESVLTRDLFGLEGSEPRWL